MKDENLTVTDETTITYKDNNLFSGELRFIIKDTRTRELASEIKVSYTGTWKLDKNKITSNEFTRSYSVIKNNNSEISNIFLKMIKEASYTVNKIVAEIIYIDKNKIIKKIDGDEITYLALGNTK